MHVAVYLSIAVMVLAGYCEDTTHTSTVDSKLETYCGEPAAENKIAVTSNVSYPFRTDYLTLNECMAYQNVPCSATKFSRCNVHVQSRHGRRDYSILSPLNKTYFELDCSQDGWRSFLQDFTKNYSILSSQRALTVKITERNDENDPVHRDVFWPVREQIIDITIQGGATTIVTSKIYDVGVLPNLVALRIKYSKNLSIKRRDFNLIPSVKLIVFHQSTIAQMEPYTFTDLPYLSGLSVDKGVFEAYGDVERRRYETSMEAFRRPASLWSDADFDKIRRIHCDCSFAWYRNFLKSKPALLEHKRPGAMAVIGSYKSEYFDVFNFDSHVIPVDCAANELFTISYTDNGEQVSLFADNTDCFHPC